MKERKKADSHKCFNCGGELIWDTAECRTDDDDSIVDFYHCKVYGTSYEVFVPNKEEKQNYKEYWEKRQQNKKIREYERF